MTDPMVTDLAILAIMCAALWLAGELDQFMERHREFERRRIEYVKAEYRAAAKDAGWCEFCGAWGYCCVCGQTHEKTAINAKEML